MRRAVSVKSAGCGRCPASGIPPWSAVTGNATSPSYQLRRNPGPILFMSGQRSGKVEVEIPPCDGATPVPKHAALERVCRGRNMSHERAAPAEHVALTRSAASTCRCGTSPPERTCRTDFSWQALDVERSCAVPSLRLAMPTGGWLSRGECRDADRVRTHRRGGADGGGARRIRGLGLPASGVGVHAVRGAGIPGVRGSRLVPDPDPAAPRSGVERANLQRESGRSSLGIGPSLRLLREDPEPVFVIARSLNLVRS